MEGATFVWLLVAVLAVVLGPLSVLIWPGLGAAVVGLLIHGEWVYSPKKVERDTKNRISKTWAPNINQQATDSINSAKGNPKGR